MRFFASTTVLLLLLLTLSSVHSIAQVQNNPAVLKQAAVLQAEKEKILYVKLQAMSKEKGWPMIIRGKNGYIAALAGIDGFGMPLYLATDNNITAAATIGTNKLWPGGSTGLNLSGSSANMTGKLGIWDGGNILGTHVELAGRVLQKDNAGQVDDHATHVAGTLIASGVNPLAKGMSFGQQQLIAYNFDNDLSEMMSEGNNLLVSNHSYGFNAGWSFNQEQNRWEFLGAPNSTEDYKFGYYSDDTQIWDSIAYAAPYHLMVKSAGNSRSENGPAVGEPYWRYNAANVMASAGNRPAGISSNDGYDIISTTGTAKNILLVGAINPISSGYNGAQDVVLSDFTAWGPTDDGRIKPDVVADGVGLLSSFGTGNNAYAILDGTSMSSPNAAGSLFLLQEYYSRLHAGTFMRSATLKGLAIHTADEAGAAPGPDYQFGWGLLDMQKAAAAITADNTTHTQLIQEKTLTNGGSYTLPVVASGNGTISATISWTDPKGSVGPEVLNNSARKLVNDLDIVVKKGAVTYRPWVLTPGVPSAAATRGDNVLDNVEKVELPDVVPGEAYTIEVTHKGTLEKGSQAFSLLASGIGGQTYCASAPASTAGARIDSVSLSNVKQKNPAGCTDYTSYTNLTANLEPGQVVPFYIMLNSCDASTAGKMVRIFIDANSDGDFTDAGETLATSSVINGNGPFAGNITVPAGLTVGQYTLLRIVMQETTSAASLIPCGSYTRGETQDFRIKAVTPSVDFGVNELLSPETGNCASTQQYVTVRIHNFGTTGKKNIPLTAVVTQGATTIATLTATYADSIYAKTDELYTFQTPVAISSGASYTITATASFPGDQNTANDQLVSNVTTNSPTPNPTGSATLCQASVTLKANAVTGTESFNWYSSASAATPLASGATATTTTVLPTYYLSTGEQGTKLGPVNKMAFAEGGYNVFSGNIVKFTAAAPTTIETARLYIGTPGKITFTIRQIISVNDDGSYSYYPIAVKTIDVYATAPTSPALGAQINDPADLGAIYRLGLNFPAAADYFVIIQCDNGASIFRNNNITTNPYPFSVPGVISITGNNATDATDPDYYQKFYYFFYDATLRPASCPSGRTAIVPVTATAPVVTLNGNLLTSNAASGNQWYLNGVAISGATNPTYTAVYTGVYKVQATGATGCTLFSNEVNFAATPVSNVDPSEIGLIISPNPASAGQFTLQLETTTRSDLSISLISTVGQKVYQTVIPGFTGRLSKLVHTGKIASGVYYLQVLHDKKMYIKKVIMVD